MVGAIWTDYPALPQLMLLSPGISVGVLTSNVLVRPKGAKASECDDNATS